MITRKIWPDGRPDWLNDYWEATIEDHVIAPCPECDNTMLLGEMWKELFEEGYAVPPCPECDDGEGDSWSDDADPLIDSIEAVALTAAGGESA